MVDFATNCLLIENAGKLQFVACHRLSNKADAATLIIFVDLYLSQIGGCFTPRT